MGIVCLLTTWRSFDSLHRETLWKILRHYGVPKKLVNIRPVKNWYGAMSCRVIHDGQLTKNFEIRTGVTPMQNSGGPSCEPGVGVLWTRGGRLENQGVRLVNQGWASWEPGGPSCEPGVGVLRTRGVRLVNQGWASWEPGVAVLWTRGGRLENQGWASCEPGVAVLRTVFPRRTLFEQTQMILYLY